MSEADTSDAALQHYIIKDSCPEDDSADFIRVRTPYRVQFKFQSFKFGPNRDKLYMSCSATVCPSGDISNLCRSLCGHVQHPIRSSSLALGETADIDQEEPKPFSENQMQSMGGRSDDNTQSFVCYPRVRQSLANRFASGGQKSAKFFISKQGAS